MSIRSKALHSSSRLTQQDASRIDQNPQGELRKIQQDLRSGKFKFQPQKGVLKKRDGKKPRPLVISPVLNRIVQRAILDTIQSEKPTLRNKLGTIPNVLDTPTSVGGIPRKGALDAVALMRDSISNGAKYFVRSDIKDFFTKIKTAELIAEIRKITDDDDFANMIETGLNVELANANDPSVKEWRSLFPDVTTGVPQGSSLSAFCANFVLKEFDVVLNQGGVLTVRYIDDFVILGTTEEAVQAAWISAKSILTDLGLEAHEPVVGGSKASLGAIADGFDFLSYRFVGRNIGLSSAAKKSFLNQVDKVIGEAKRSVGKPLSQSRRAEAKFAQALVDLDRRIRGWGDSFRAVDQRLEFKQLDDKVISKVGAFIGWYKAYSSNKSSEQKMRALGIALLHDTPPA